MKVKAVLWTNFVTQDGTSRIMIYAYSRGKKKYYNTGIHVRPENWSETKEKVIGLPQYIKDSYNALIEAKKTIYIKKLGEGIPANKLEEEIKEIKSHSLLEFLNQYIKEVELGLHGIKPNTLKNYKSVRTRLYQYCEDHRLHDLLFDQIDMKWYTQYYKWVKDKKLGFSGFDKVIKILKKIMRVALERGIHNNRIYEYPEFKKLPVAKGDKIYLNIAEIELLEKLDLSTLEYLERERDRFLISYYFMMRWEDSTLIRKDKIIEHLGLNYSYTAKKTGIKCIVPISTKARALLEKRNYSFDADSNQKANVKIKEIVMLAGITDVTEQNGIIAPKFKFVTTHTARRSAATNLYLAGMDLETIARIGGWKKLETLKIYLRASGLDVAQNAKKFDFFK